MASKEFKATIGLSNGETSETVITYAIINNTANTIDTVALNSFHSIEYNITIVQGSKIRTSAISVQTDGTSVDSTEYGIVATGGAISGVAITATASGSNMLLQVTITDAATTIARVRAVKNLLGAIQPYAPGAPVIGTATAGAEQATVTFTAPADNGLSAITSYLAISTPGSITGSAASSPITITGLTGGTAYTFIVQAINAYGRSLASVASNSVTPTAVLVGAGYISGGQTVVNGTPLSTVNKLTFSNESVTTLSTGLSSIRTRASSLANSGTAGYVIGGNTVNGGGVTNSVEKILFTGDLISTLSATLSTARTRAAAFANSGTAGYNTGGDTTNQINKITFSNDSIALLGSTLTRNRLDHIAFANSGTAGYAGADGSSSNSIDKLTFSNDSVSLLSATLSSNKTAGAGLANSGTAGYAIDGGDGSGIDKFVFPNDTRSTITATLPLNISTFAAFAKSGTAGYVAGGQIGQTVYNTIYKLAFSDDTISTLSSTLSGNRYATAGMANSGTL